MRFLRIWGDGIERFRGSSAGSLSAVVVGLMVDDWIVWGDCCMKGGSWEGGKAASVRV